MNADDLLASARARNRAVKARTQTSLAKLASENGGASERATLAMIERDTRAVRKFAQVMRRYPKYLRHSFPVTLPSGKTYRWDANAGTFQPIEGDQ